jgi:hypothetical protein
MVAIIALLVIGAAIRAWGVLIDPLDLWADEAWWAQLLESRSLDNLGFRPIGYMWLCRYLLALGDPAVTLRLPSLLAGVAALYCIHRSAELLFHSRAAVLFVLLLAVFHPNLIVFSKEFKPYSVEVFVYSGLIYWALLAMRRGRAGSGFWAAATIALPFCYPAVFMYPALALAFAGEQLGRLYRYAQRHAFIVLLVGIPAIFLLNMFLFDLVDAGRNRYFWGRKYGVFPIDTGVLGGIAWYARKTWALISLPGALDAVPLYARFLFGVAYVGGTAAMLLDRRYREFVLLSGPLAMAAIANVLGYWPYGAFRANLFLIPGSLLLTGYSVEWLAARQPLKFAAYGVVAAVLIAAVSVDPLSYRTKSIAHWAPSPQLTEVMDDIDRRRRADPDGPQDVLLADWHSWRPISFYLRDYPDLGGRIRLVQGPLADLAGLESQISAEVEHDLIASRPTRLWVVVTRLQPHGGIRSNPMVERFLVYRREFATHDRNYHPLLMELRIPANSTDSP